MRWLTTDPLGFKDGLNLYAYVHNHPFYYKDPDGQFAFVLPFVIGTFGEGGLLLLGPTIEVIIGIAAGTALGWGAYQACQWVDNTYNQVEADSEKNEIEIKERKGRKKEKIMK
jgi:hypothetical protein